MLLELSDETFRVILRCCAVETRRQQPTHFTAAEDKVLALLVDTKANYSWPQIAEQLAHATGEQAKSAAQIAQRWRRVLRPGIKKGAWTPAEDERLRALMLRGCSWCQAAREFGSRTDIYIKGRACRLRARKSE